MRKALDNVERMDPQYKALTNLQILTAFGSGLLMLFGIFLILFGTMSNKKEKWQEAYDSFYEITESGTDSEVVTEGIDLLNNGSVQGALKKYPEKKAEILHAIGDSYFRQKQYEDAIDYYKEALDTGEVQENYLRDYMGKWRDEHLRIEGDAVKDLQRLFIADWARVTDECLDLRRYVAPHGIRQRLPIQLAWSEEGPSRLTIAEAFAAAVVRARQRVRICSPYFLPPTLILDALRLAARGGIRVEVMIPTCSDSPFSDLVSDSYVADLLDAGVELYRYDNGFLHAKLVIVDDTLASVGTANMDYRSLTDNLEVTAFIRDRETVRQLAATFDDDLASCRRITRAEWRPPLWRRTLGDVLRLVSPLM